MVIFGDFGLDYLVLHHFTVCLPMACEMRHPQKGKIALVTFVWLFSAVSFHMFCQITHITRGIFALITLVRSFSTVRFLVTGQRAFLRRRIIAFKRFSHQWLLGPHKSNLESLNCENQPQMALSLIFKQTTLLIDEAIPTGNLQVFVQIALSSNPGQIHLKLLLSSV